MKIYKRVLVFIGLNIIIFLSVETNEHFDYAYLILYLFSLVMALLLNIKTNKYLINMHNLTILGLLWFGWVPLVDILYISNIYPIRIVGNSIFNSISMLSDTKLSIIFLFFISFGIFYYLFIYILSNSKFTYINKLNNNNINIKKVYLLGIISVLFLVILNIKGSQINYETVTSWTETGHGFLLGNIKIMLTFTFSILFYLYIIKKVDKKFKIILISLVLLYIYYLATKEFTRLFLITFILSLLVGYERGKDKTITMKQTGLLSIVMVGYIIFMGFYRTAIGSKNDAITSLNNVASNTNFLDMLRSYLEVFPGIDYFYTLYFDSSFNYSAIDYIIRFFAFFIPRFIYQDKPESISVIAGQAIIGNGFSCSVTSIGEVTIIAGILGVITFALLHALLVSIIDKNTSTLGNIIFIAIAPYAFQFIRGPLDSMFHRIVIVFILIYIFIDIKKYNDNQSVLRS